MRSLLLLVFYLYIHSFRNDMVQGIVSSSDVDEEKTFIWGPGLNPDKVTLRARYIFLQLVDKSGQNLTESPGKKLVSAQIDGESQKGRACQIWPQIFDCKDGSFIIRYRTYSTCYNLKIIIRVKNKILPLKTSEFQGPIYEEECDCPNPSIESWLDNNDCAKNYTQMIEDLSHFPSVDFNSIRHKIIERYNKPKSFGICHYVIKFNKIYRKCYGEHVGFNRFMDTTLLSLTRKTILPDIEFFMNLGDYPIVPKNKALYPIFSWCGSETSRDIILPTYDITQSSIEAMASVMLDMLSVQGSTKLSWDKKVPKVFWRGRDSSIARLKIIDIARQYPDLVNASITNFLFFLDKKEKYGPEVKHISFFDFFEYKYQLNIDGSVAAYRFPYLLAGDSLVFKQDSVYYEYFYKDLEKDKHFIPVKSNLSDLIDKVKWAIKNDDEVYEVTREARKYVRNNLMPQNIFCYHTVLFNEWSKRIKSPVEVLPEMEQVTQPEHKCECLTSEKGKKDEL